MPYYVSEQGHKTEFPAIAIRHLPCVLGRASACDERLDHPLISRRHCAFSLRDGQVWVEDLASRNGTRLDGETVLAPRPIADGATLQLAYLTFTIRVEGSAAQPALPRDWKQSRG
jgi:pSer/pThr/pTyr-binding forkhead associated (FHA) protein